MPSGQFCSLSRCRARAGRRHPAPVFVPAAPPVQMQRKSHAGLIIALVMVFLLLAAAGGGAFYVFHLRSANEAALSENLMDHMWERVYQNRKRQSAAAFRRGLSFIITDCGKKSIPFLYGLDRRCDSPMERRFSEITANHSSGRGSHLRLLFSQ